MKPEPAAPHVFDRVLLQKRRQRALMASLRPRARDGGFLLDQVGTEVRERLDAVERHFDLAVDLTGDDGRTADLMASSHRVGSLIDLTAGSAQGTATSSHQLPRAVADDEWLPLAPQSLDLVTSVLSLQWVNDLPGTLIQIRRALRPDGLLLGAMIGGNSLHELRAVLAAEEEESTGGVTPRVAPFVDVRDLGSLLQRAGFALPVTDVDTITVRYGNLFVLMADLRAMGATNILNGRTRVPWTKGRAVRAAQIYAQRYADEDGRIRATFQVLSFSGWAPSDGQQKPLRPGSAKARLADALDTSELPAGDQTPRKQR